MEQEEKKAVWLTVEEMDILAGFVAELLDRKKLAYWQIEALENLYNQLEQEQKNGIQNTTKSYRME